MIIRWNRDQIHGIVDLEAMRKFYNERKLKSIRGEVPKEPAAGHVFVGGSEKEPIQITSIDYKRKVVNLIKVPKRLAKSLFSKDFQIGKNGIEIPIRK